MREDARQRRATIYDVARKAGVCAATVSKVLRGVTTVRPENAERVHAAVSELGYRMDPVASGLRNEQRRMIGAVLPDLESPFFGALATGLERAAEAAGYQLIVASSRECELREEALVSRMNDWRVSGAVLVPVRSERGRGPARLRALGMHAVLVDRASADDTFDTVAADNYEASAAVADLLLGQGHAHVLLVGQTRISKAVQTRAEGFAARVRERAPRLRVEQFLCDDELDAQRRALSAYLDTNRPEGRPTAIFCLSQRSTLMTLCELRRRGIRIPEEVALVGFDDAEWMQITWPSIAAVAQPVEAMAERAVSALLARVTRERRGFPVQHLERCTLVVRQSAGPADEFARANLRSG